MISCTSAGSSSASAVCLGSGDLRFLSTSSTLMATACEETTAVSQHPCFTAAKPDVGGEIEKSSELQLALLFLRAPRENFSFHWSPSFSDSSVMGTQARQQSRRGTVSNGFPNESVVGKGRDGRRFLEAVCGEGPPIGEEGKRWTRQGDSGFCRSVGGFERERTGDLGDLAMKLHLQVKGPKMDDGGECIPRNVDCNGR
jgi:hypothetical protein